MTTMPAGHTSRILRPIAIALVWMMAATIAILVPTTPVAANETPAPASTFGERLTTALDRATRSVVLDVNCDRHPEASRCTGESAPAPAPPVVDSPAPEVLDRSGPAIQERRGAAISFGRLPTPRWRIWPDHTDDQVVNLNTILRVTSEWRHHTWSIGFLWFSITITATPLFSRWTFRETEAGGRDRVTCIGPGIPWLPGMTSSYCDKSWEHSSDVTGDVHMEMEIIYLMTVNGFPFPYFDKSPDEAMLPVAEIQARGRSTEFPVFELVSGPGTSEPEDEGGECSFWGISIPCGIGDAIADAAAEVVQAAVDFILERAPWLREVYNFFEGCGDGVLNQLGGIRDILTSLWEAIQNPGEAFDETVQMLKDLYEAATSDPEAFLIMMGEEFLDVEYWEEHGASAWAGKTVCELAIDILLGNAGARIVNKIKDFVRRTPDGPDGPDRPNDPDNDCLLSSFPAGTMVVMGDGTHLAIETIRPGDSVLSFNRDTSVWEPKLVLDQWSHVDRGPPATAYLADGSHITATDDHPFYVAGSDDWVELAHVRSDDQLLTPAGLVDVDHVEVGPAHTWTVWELTIAENHNFAVVAGDTPVLVHNCLNAGNKAKADDVRARLAADGLDVTAEELAQAWQRYLRDNPDADFDTWLNQYETIRRNNFLGNAYESQILDEKYGITSKNGKTFTDPKSGTEFKPDAVVSENPPHFVEIKDYQNTTLYPGSNAGKALEYLKEQAEAGNPGTFDLHISDPSNISPGMQQLINDARAAGVTVNVNP